MRRSGRTHQLGEEVQNLYQVARQGDGIVQYNELEQGYFLRAMVRTTSPVKILKRLKLTRWQP